MPSQMKPLTEFLLLIGTKLILQDYRDSELVQLLEEFTAEYSCVLLNMVELLQNMLKKTLTKRRLLITDQRNEYLIILHL